MSGRSYFQASAISWRTLRDANPAAEHIDQHSARVVNGGHDLGTVIRPTRDVRFIHPNRDAGSLELGDDGKDALALGACIADENIADRIDHRRASGVGVGRRRGHPAGLTAIRRANTASLNQCHSEDNRNSTNCKSGRF